MLQAILPHWDKAEAAIKLIWVRPLFEITRDLSAPSDVAVGTDGTIYVVDGVHHAIRVYDARGKFVSSFGTEGSRDGQFQSPLGMDIDHKGRLYIADSGNHRIQIFDAAGTFLRTINISAQAGHPADPTDLAVDGSGKRCYVVDNDNHRILVYDLTNDQPVATFGSPGAEKHDFMYPFRIALDRQKNLNIVEVINARVQVLKPDGLFVSFIGSWGVEKGQFFRPKGIAVAQDGKVYVSDSYIQVIQVFDANGKFYAAVAQKGVANVKKFESPVSLYIDRFNRLYVVEMFADKVGVYQILPEPL
jgi:DNA-binding beta-propeller fold protein YncE